MTLDEAKSLAEQGDLDSIMALGRYYYGKDANNDDEDINEALKWYEKGAEFGYPICMYLTSILCNVNGHVMRKIVAGEDGIVDVLEVLDKALFWAKLAKEKNVEGADKHITTVIAETGIAYFYYATGGKYSNKPTNQEKIERYEQAINLLKSIYKDTDNPETYIFLALSLHYYGELVGYSEENNSLEFRMYHKCVDEYFGEISHTDFAAVNLATMYTYGRGCSVDYDKAVYYLQKAHNSGLDCSEILSCFKKKMFGGYTLK